MQLHRMWPQFNQRLLLSATALLLIKATPPVAAHSGTLIGKKIELESVAQPAIIAATGNGPTTANLLPKYFQMDGHGNYQYAYDSGSGLTGVQTANKENEVSGHYTHIERGIPYTVKYRAGVQGYQAEIIPHGPTAASATVAPLTTGHAHLGYSLQSAASQSHGARSAAAGVAATATAITTPALVPIQMQPLQFVEHVMKTIHRHPLQISFATQQSHLLQREVAVSHRGEAHSTVLIPKAVTGAYTTNGYAAGAPLAHSEVQQINTLADDTAEAQQHDQSALSTSSSSSSASHGDFERSWPRRPYAFTYQSDHAAHTASADAGGNVIGKYSYHDQAGYHDLAYKADPKNGFTVVGGNLAKGEALSGATAPVALAVVSPSPAAYVAAAAAATRQHFGAFGVANLGGGAAAGNHGPPPLLVVSVQQDPSVHYSYKLDPLPVVTPTGPGHAVKRAANHWNGRSLRKFRHYAKW